MARVVLDQAGLHAVLRSPQSPVFRHVTDVSRQVNNQGVVEAPVDSGTLRARHQYSVSVRATSVVGRIGTTVDYGWTVHEGHKEIRPIHGTLLKFKVGGHWVYAKRVRAVPGNPWLERALRKVTGMQLQRSV